MATQVDTITVQQIANRLDAISTQLTQVVERQRKQDEMFTEFAPILKEVMATATTNFADLEKKGYFAFGKEALGVFQRIVEGYSADDVRQLGDAVVGILDTVRSLTQPEVLAIAGQASEVLQNADKAAPVGIFGMVRATRDDEVQRGMAVMLDVLKHVGRGAQALAQRRHRSPGAGRLLRLEATTGRSSRKVLGVERPVRAPGENRPASKSTCAVPSDKPMIAATVIDGIEFTADGHMVDATVWTQALGTNIAKLQGMELLEAHWKIVDFARGEYLETKASPNIRRITQATGISTKELYVLFPKAPARTVAKIAGIPKPVGCL
jgi:TusE/DsrC/DsvC family sulfur relay protein